MKGQFFVIGAILIASLFFAGLPLTGYITKPVSDDLDFFSQNIDNEFPRALNLAIDEGDLNRLKDFSNFADSQITQKNAIFKNLWVVTEAEGSNVNVTVGNFLDEDVNIALNISNTIEMMLIPSGFTDSVMFFGVPSQFTLRVTFTEADRELDFQRDKINLYSFFSLSRGEDIMRREVIA